MYRILIVDDDPEISSLIRIHIEQAGFHTVEAESGRQAIARMQEQAFDLMILDLMMDDGNGYEVLQYLRDNRSKILVISLSARREVDDKVDILGLGADDYVTKPFSPKELVARVLALLRRQRSESTPQSESIRLNELVLDISNLALYNAGTRRNLTPYECELLQLFMKNPDRILTKRDIYQQVWKHENYDDNNLSVFIRRLRTLLEETADSPFHLHTVRGVGYRFSGDGR
jgi:DNA-binding response OmpR family regulator